MATYEIHHNGAIPYIVTVAGNNVSVKTYLNQEVLYFENVKKIFIGEDYLLPDMRKLIYDEENHLITPEKIPAGEQEYEPYPGNSILVNIKDNIYVYIGPEVYEFKTEDEIVKYFSPIGPNDVPYPYAVGTQYTYFMLEKQYVKNNVITEPKDPYRNLYNTYQLANGMKYISEQSKLKRKGEPYDEIIDEDEDAEENDPERDFNIPLETPEDNEKFIKYRINKYNLDPQYYEQYKQYKHFDHKIIRKLFLY